MGKKQKKIFVGFIIGYGIVSFICLFLVATKCAKNSNWMSYLGSYLGGILGGLATLMAIYFTLESIKQDNMVYIIPLKTMLYGYYEKNHGCFVSTENIDRDSPILLNGEDNKKVIFDSFNTFFMRFANIGKDSAINIKFEWGSPFDSELYDILLGYGIPHEYFAKHFNTENQTQLCGDYVLPVKLESEPYNVQIADGLIEVLKYTMAVFLGYFDEYAIDEKTKMEFGNNFVNQQLKFSELTITFDDLNGNTIIKKFIIYCHIERILGTYNNGYNKMQIILSANKLMS